MLETKTFFYSSSSSDTKVFLNNEQVLKFVSLFNNHKLALSLQYIDDIIKTTSFVHKGTVSRP